MAGLIRRLKPLLWAATVVALAGGGWLGWRIWSARGRAEATSTQVVTASRGSLVASISPIGEVQPEQRVALGFDVTSRITLLELPIVAGQQVQTGDLLARIDEAPLQRALDQAEATLIEAETALEEAQTPASEAERAKAEFDVSQAEVSLEEAREALDELTTTDLASAQSSVRDAERALQLARDRLAALEADRSAQTQIDTLQWRANEAEVEHGALLQQTETTELGLDRQHLAYNRMMDARDNLETARIRAELDLLNARTSAAQAEQALAKAQSDLATLRAGPDVAEIGQARNRVTQAELALASAQEALETAVGGPDPQAIRQAQTRYDSALAAFEEAQAALDGAVLRAPFDGTILSVGVREGDTLTTNTTVVTLADLSELRVLAMVDETEIGQVQAGQEAEITFDALAGQRFSGVVLEVPLEGTLSQNIVTYSVPIRLEAPAGTSLLPGMTANVRLVVGRREDALLLPVLAVQEAEDGYVAMVQDTPGGPTMATRVQLGLSDGQYVEVVRGLIEGDRVVVQLQAATTQTGFGLAGGGQMIPGGGAMPIQGGNRGR